MIYLALFVVKMNFNELKNKHIHFIGCGGIGMLGLAFMVHERGAIVTGSDIDAGKNTFVLESLGVRVFIGEHKASNLPSETKNCIVVYSAAVKQDNPELLKARIDGIPCFKRGVFLGMLSKTFETVISVGGSHGKTTITSMISHVLIKAGLNPGFYIGGFPHGWARNASCVGNKILITEADESDLSINELHPTIGIALNLDNDHAWNVGGLDKLLDGFRKYAADSKFFLNGSDKFPNGFLNDLKSKGINFLYREHIPGLDPNLTHAEKDNIITVITAAKFCGIAPEFTLSALKDFPGVERRMNEVFVSENLIAIEDYAHHPAEINAVLSLARRKYSEYKIVVVFQPHREKRLQYCFDGFVTELTKADFVFVLPVYGAWENIGNRLDIKLSEMIGKEKSSNISSDWSESVNAVVSSITSQKTLLMLLGAGDINHIIEPLITALSRRFK